MNLVYPCRNALIICFILLIQRPALSQANTAVLGLWKNEQFGFSMVLQLNHDGSGAFDDKALQYTVNGNVLMVTIDLESIAYSFSVNGNQLILSGGDLNGRVIFSRAAGTDSSKATERSLAFSATSHQLIGLWSGDGEMIEFKGDGTCRYGGSLFPYSISQGHLILETGAGKAIFEYVFEEGDLVLIANGQKSRYTRPAGSTGTSQAKLGAKNPLDLVGRWCYLNMTTQAQSSRCITLNADGTYTYATENARNVLVSGSASSKRVDSGTWFVAGDRMYYQSMSGESGSYRLEKRNHPQNGNHPMIVLDDEPFVTTMQRPPWR